MAAYKFIDWDMIEHEYISGVYTNAGLAKKYQIAESSLSKRAKQLGWIRVNDKKKIKAQSSLFVTAAEIEADKNYPQSLLDTPDEDEDDDRVFVQEYIATLDEDKPKTEAELIDYEAKLQAKIKLEHRREIQSYRRLNAKLKYEIESNPNADDVHKRVDSSKKLSDTLKTLIGLEREAFGISDNANGEADSEIDSLFKQIIASTMPPEANP